MGLVHVIEVVRSADPLLLVSPAVAVVVPVLGPLGQAAVDHELLIAGAVAVLHVDHAVVHPVWHSVAIGVHAHARVEWIQVELVVDSVVVVVQVALVENLGHWQNYVVDPDRVCIAADAGVLVVHPLESVVPGAHRGGVRPGCHSRPAHRQTSVDVEPEVVPVVFRGGLVCE